MFIEQAGHDNSDGCVEPGKDRWGCDRHPKEPHSCQKLENDYRHSQQDERCEALSIDNRHDTKDPVHVDFFREEMTVTWSQLLLF